MSLILVTGGTGLLGSDLVPFLKKGANDVKTLARTGDADINADLSDPKAIDAVLDTLRPDNIVNLAGLTNVDLCQEDPHLAYLGNVRAIENIACWIAKENRCHLIQISTDHVYDGPGPHDEADVTLTNMYAFSKYAGELAAKSVPSSILRTNFFGLSHAPKRVSFTDWIATSLKNGDSIQVFDDVLFSPLSMETLCAMIGLVLDKKPRGVFNLGSSQGMSKAAFAFAFAEKMNLQTRTMKRIKKADASFLKTYRPSNMVLNNAALERALGVVLPPLEDEITRAARSYHAKA